MLKNQKAFTLIELMVVMVVIAIVISVAVPSFKQAILSNKSAALAEDFSTALNFARLEAVKRADRVSLCASSDGSTCTGSWTDGFITFVDTATTNETTTPVVGTILRNWAPSDARTAITVTRAAANTTFIRYTSLGTLARINTSPVIVVTSMQGCVGNAANTITLGLSGVVSIAKSVCP